MFVAHLHGHAALTLKMDLGTGTIPAVPQIAEKESDYKTYRNYTGSQAIKGCNVVTYRMTYLHYFRGIYG